MFVYKILFDNNQVAFCHLDVLDTEIIGDVRYKIRGKLLVHAFLKSESRESAIAAAIILGNAFSAGF